MNEPITFSNIIKYDLNKCTLCKNCINVCEFGALSIDNETLKFDNTKCYACKKCLSVCKDKALFYNINDGVFEGSNVVGIVPFNADVSFLSKKYAEVITYELGEKIKVIETAFEMDEESSKKINNKPHNPLIISDYSNIDLLLNLKYKEFIKYLSKVKSVYYISSYLYRLMNKNKKLKISAYGVPFESKIDFSEIKIIDELCDIPYKANHKYNILDIINTYIHIGKFNNNSEISELIIKNNQVINLTNGYLDIKVLLLNDINYLEEIDISLYDFIFICKNNKYVTNGNLLKDYEVNKIYKSILKAPGAVEQLLKRR